MWILEKPPSGTELGHVFFVQGFGFGSMGFRVSGSAVWGFGLRVSGLRCRVESFGFRV